MKKLKHIYISSSGMKEYKECPRKWAWSRMEGLTPGVIADESLEAHFKGTLIHEAIDALYQGKSWEARFDELILPGAAIRSIRADRAGSIAHIKDIIKEYIEFYECPNDPDFEVIATEKSIELPLTDWLTFTAKIDKIGIRKRDNKKILVDHKTTSNIYSWVRPTVDVSDQFTGYIAAALANGIDTDTLIIDAISTSRSHLGQSDKMFQRFDGTRTDSQIEEWKQRLIFDAERLKFDVENGSFTTNQPDSCIKFGGCQFKEVCDAVPEIRANILRNSFNRLDRPWHCDKVVLEES